MHFSIPDTQEITDEKNNSSYHVYNIHINGVFHCMLRYRQLHDFNEKFKVEYGSSNVPLFPPKRLFSLSDSDIEDRRYQLEKYIQEIGQNPMLCDSDIFSSFLQKAQQETRLEESIAVSLDIYFMNGVKVTIDIDSTDQTEDVIENVLGYIGLPDDLVYYFGLFLMHDDNNSTLSFVRMLQDFESPYISLKCLKNRLSYKIVLRTVYWDQSCDNIVCANDVGLNLLFVQAQHDVRHGWTQVSQKARKQLNSLTVKNLKLDYIQLVQSQINYGFLQFNKCNISYPSFEGKGIVCVGNFQFQISMQRKQGDIHAAKSFPVTKIRSWRVASSCDEEMLKNPDQPVLQLSLEVLIKKGTLIWISIYSDQAIMMSMCVKSMVTELLRKRNGEKVKKPSDRTKRKKHAFKARDKSTECLFNKDDMNEMHNKVVINSVIQNIDSNHDAETLSGYSSLDSQNESIVFNNGIGDNDL